MNPRIQVKRARAYYIYSNDNRRYLDFSQEAGFAILGHRPKGVAQLIKNNISMGMLGSAPAFRAARIQRGLDRLISGWHASILCFSWQELAYRIGGGKPVVIYDPATRHYLKIETEGLSVYQLDQSLPSEVVFVFLWRPYLSVEEIDSKFHYLVPVVPFPFSPNMLLLCMRQSGVQQNFNVAPFLLTAYTRSLYLLANNKPEYPKLTISPNWHQFGPYLLHNSPEDVYDAMIESFLEAAIIIPAQYYWPIIIPACITHREIEIYKEIAQKY